MCARLLALGRVESAILVLVELFDKLDGLTDAAGSSGSSRTSRSPTSSSILCHAGRGDENKSETEKSESPEGSR